MKVNIALVGGQAAPVFHVIEHYGPDKVVLIVSEDKKSQKAYDVIEKECHNIGIKDITKVLLDPVEPAIVTAKANELFEQFKEDEVIVNVSSGTKVWSHVFGYRFQGANNSTVVYIDQNNLISNFRSNKREYYYGFDLFRNFRLNGIQEADLKYSIYSEYTDTDLIVVDKIAKIWQSDNRNILKTVALVDDDINKALTQGEKQYSYSKEVKNPKGKKILVSVSWSRHIDGSDDTLVTIKANEKRYNFQSPNALAIVFNSGWFECYVARLFSNWSKTKSDVIMNCRFPSKKNSNNKTTDLNEADVIVNAAGTKAVFVECKTSISKPTDIDKFASVVKNYGGSGSKGIFVSFAPITEDRIEKLTKNGLSYFSLTRKGNVEEQLYQYLDSELLKTNV